jgi:alpha-D-ribose 1-methylphosphonate 5-triphosphate diphosphatase
MTEFVLRNLRAVTADAELPAAAMVVRDGKIAAVDPAGAAAGHDWEGDYLLPGFVELHTDNLEKHLSPRPGVRWPAADAVLAHDAQIAAAGITTVYDAVSVGDMFERSDRVENLNRMVDALSAARAAGALRAEHLVHLRCEVTYPGVVELTEALLPRPEVALVSIMDHTPGQRQFVDESKLRHYYVKKHGMTDAQFDAFAADRRRMHETYGAAHRAALIELARTRGIALASHDDATVEHVAESVAAGMTIAEFPTTPEAAKASHEAGLAVLMGAPNLVLGGSHSGNVAAIDLARAGHVDILSSDYVPASLLRGVFQLAGAGIGFDLPKAAATAARNPARAAGIADRGELAAGQRADFLRVRVAGGTPHVREVWREGKRIA